MGKSVINWGGGVVVPNLSENSMYPLQTNVATKEFNRIENLRANLSTYGMTKLSTASDVTDANSYALSAVEKNASVSGTLANIVSKNTRHVNWASMFLQNAAVTCKTSGWYRFGYTVDTAYRNSPSIWNTIFKVIFARSWNHTPGEVHEIMCFSAADSFLVKQICELHVGYFITKLRACFKDSIIYYDFYYSYTIDNDIMVYLNSLYVQVHQMPSITMVADAPAGEQIISEYTLPSESP